MPPRKSTVQDAYPFEDCFVPDYRHYSLKTGTNVDPKILTQYIVEHQITRDLREEVVQIICSRRGRPRRVPPRKVSEAQAEGVESMALAIKKGGGPGGVLADSKVIDFFGDGDLQPFIPEATLCSTTIYSSK